VFVDGLSLTTGEPIAVAISKRAKGLARKSPLTTASNLIWLIPFISFTYLLRLPSYGRGGMVLIAIVGGVAIDFGVTGGAYLALNRLLKRELSGRRAMAAAAVVYVATFAAVMLVYTAALAMVRG
jgi:hypothetical protein